MLPCLYEQPPRPRPRRPPGPFRSWHVSEGSHYELSNGHPIQCMSAGERHAKANAQGALALATDPGLRGDLGINAGIEFNGGKNLRAPDLVLGIEGKPGWSRKIPPICVEYADRGQDEEQLRQKVEELLEAGVQHIWVLRLAGPLRAEVHEPGKKMRVVDADGALEAPGVLVNRYTPRQLVDQEEALRVAFRKQLQAQGYDGLEAVREEGRQQALASLRGALLDLCEVLDVPLDEERRRRIAQMDTSALDSLRQALKAGRRWPDGMNQD